MKAFFACGHDTIKADGIAVGTLHALRQHYPGKLRLSSRLVCCENNVRPSTTDLNPYLYVELYVSGQARKNTFCGGRCFRQWSV